MNLMFLWLIGSVIVAIDILYTLQDDPLAQLRFQGLDIFEKISIFMQLMLLCFIGSWFIIASRIGTYVYFNYLRRRK